MENEEIVFGMCNGNKGPPLLDNNQYRMSTIPVEPSR